MGAIAPRVTHGYRTRRSSADLYLGACDAWATSPLTTFKLHIFQKKSPNENSGTLMGLKMSSATF